MAWQAVNRMHYSQAGGGGPQGVASRAGSAGLGFEVLTRLAFGVGDPMPTATPTEVAVVRHALTVWEVNTVVIATNPAAPRLQQGSDPVYAAAFMTAALGRLPTVQAGAFVWDHVQVGLQAPLVVPADTLGTCVSAAERSHGSQTAVLDAPYCVVLAARAAGAAPAAPATPTLPPTPPPPPPPTTPHFPPA